MAKILTRGSSQGERSAGPVPERRTRQIIPWLFQYPPGRRHQGQRRRSFAKAWAKACEKAKVPRRILHDCRRTAVRNRERAGVPRSVAMTLTGHKAESVYRRCAIVNDAALREAMQRLIGHVFAHAGGRAR